MSLEWLRPPVFLGSILFALVGVLVFWISFIVIDRITPYDLWAEIVEKQNKALAMVVAACAWASASSWRRRSTGAERAGGAAAARARRPCCPCGRRHCAGRSAGAPPRGRRVARGVVPATQNPAFHVCI